MTDQVTLDIIDELKWSENGVQQSELPERVDTSKATVSRRLTHMEKEGLITRVESNGRKLVWLYEYAPPMVNKDGK